MTSGRPPTREDLAALAAEMDSVAPAAGTALWNLGEEEALWLALPPAWTVDLAEQTRFPAPVGAFVARAAQASVVEFNESIAADGSETITFWPRDGARESLLAGCLERLGPARVQDTASMIAQRILTAETTGHVVDASVHDWARVVLQADGPAAGEALLSRIREAVIADDLAGAMRTLSTAEALVPLNPRLNTAVIRARRLVHLGYRRRHDVTALGGFVRREEQIDAVRELIDGSGREWALHLIGMGGVGKTMLIRYLSSGAFARDERLPAFPVARVDFDHLSPAYPIRRPVELLVELADELAPFADNPIRGEMLDAFLDTAVSANAAAAVRPPAGDLADDPVVGYATTLFAQFVAALPQPVVLVLDTCEELAKLHPGNAEPPALARTFALLEQVQAAAPGVRVLLAGRRHLASAGCGWRLDEPGPLPERPYLRRAELRGFTRREALTYLDTGDMPGDLVEAILDRSGEAGRTSGLTTGDDGGDRYNPFDLALYRSWWQSDRTLTGDGLRAAGEDVYAEVRIVGRLQDPALERLLPAVALLGRFDETLLAPVAGEAGITTTEAVTRLAEQEWIETATDPDTGVRVLQVAPLLLPRLLRWAGRPQRRAPLETTRARLALRVAEHVSTGHLDRIGADHVVTALRLAAPAEAPRLWMDVEERIAAEGRWDWAVNVLSRVRGEFADLPGRPLLTAALTATGIAIQRRQSPFEDLESVWRPALDAVQQTYRMDGPTSDDWTREAYARLFRRAVLGMAAVRRRPSTAEELALVLVLVRSPAADPALDPSITAALETLAEQNDPAALADLRVAATAWFGDRDLSPETAAAAGVALAMMTASQGAEAESYLVAAEAKVRAEAGGPAAADLPGRPDPLIWVRLHRARLGSRFAELSRPERREQWLEEGLGRRATVDGERLVSQCLQLYLSDGTVPVHLLDMVRDEHEYTAQRRPDRLIHDAVPPLFVTLAEGYLMAGHPDRAEQVLETDRRAGRGARTEDATERLANLALARLARRLRRPIRKSLSTQLSRYLRTGDEVVRDQVWPARLLADDAAPGFDEAARTDPAVWLAWWSSQRIDADTGSVEVPAVSWTRSAVGEIPGLRSAVAQAVSIGTGPGVSDLRGWLAGQQAEPESVPFRLLDREPAGWVRAAPLDSDPFRTALLTSPPVAVAQAALETGELIALRRPRDAIEVLDLAVRLARGRSPVLAFQAAVCACLAAGNQSTERDLAGHYAEFRRHVGDPDLPAWADLPTATGYHGIWQDWLIRCRTAAAVAAGEPLPAPPKGLHSPELDPARYRTAFAEQRADVPSRPARRPRPVPRQVPPTTYYPQPGFGEQPPLAHPRSAAPVRGLPWKLIAAVIGIVGALIATLSFCAPESTAPPVNGEPGPDGPFAFQVLIVAVVIVGAALGTLGAAWWGVRWIPAVRRRFVRTFGTTSAVAVEDDAGVTVTIRPDQPPTLIWAAGRRLLMPARDRWSARMTGPVAGDRPRLVVGQQEGAATVPRHGTLVVPAGTAELDWEAAIAAATGRSDGWRLTWHRAGAGTTTNPPVTWAGGGVHILAAPGCATRVRNGYGEHLPAPEPVGGTGVESVDDGLPHLVRHLVGTPLVTSHGVLLNLDPQPRTGSPAGGRLMEPDEIEAGRYPVVVLQDLPHSGPLHLREHQLGPFRQFAAEVAAGGATIIVVLPAMPFDLVTPVTRHLARGLVHRKQPPGRRAVAQTIDAVKSEIVRYGDQRDQMAVARDVALHVVHFMF